MKKLTRKRAFGLIAVGVCALGLTAIVRESQGYISEHEVSGGVVVDRVHGTGKPFIVEFVEDPDTERPTMVRSMLIKDLGDEGFTCQLRYLDREGFAVPKIGCMTFGKER